MGTRKERLAANGPWDGEAREMMAAGTRWNFHTRSPVNDGPEYGIPQDCKGMNRGGICDCPQDDYHLALGMQTYRITIATGMSNTRPTLDTTPMQLQTESRMRRIDIGLTAKFLGGVDLNGTVTTGLGFGKHGIETNVTIEVSTNDVIAVYDAVLDLLESTDQHEAYVTINGARPQLWLKDGGVHAIV